MNRPVLIAILLGTVALSGSLDCVAGSAKILLYHHVSTDTPASTSVSPETFDSHLRLIRESNFLVVPVQQIVDALLNEREIKSNWLAITFDDAAESVLTEAAPRLQALGWPYTVFISTEFVDRKYHPYLDWDQLRELEAKGATIANHTVSHMHMVQRQVGETHKDWQSRLTREVLDSQAKLEAHLDDPSRLFSYPYGEFDSDTAELMQTLGFISFGQQSGPVGATSNPYAIPRFPMATGFDSIESLAEKLHSEHLPLLSPEVPATLQEAASDAPTLSLTIDERAGVLPGGLTCFVAGQPPARVIRTNDREFRITAEQPLNPGRSKYTCTAPHPEIPNAYYWHTHLWIKPNPDGSWHTD